MIDLNGNIYDYDTERPLKNVVVTINKVETLTDSLGYFNVKIKREQPIKIVFIKKGYSTKEISRKPDSLGEFSKRSLKYNKFYMYNKESDFYKN
ncbi:hypothetical protein SAMN05443663_10290 [Flavobacterium defluvii]|uniref:CarboxypepD_reg-like domain-containing protein n=2 Tax=Flavobacterium defluvii TaxID=370979 RepID=A0A1M5HNB7_9FLAO|nr:hypothetical protein SAMN05443663_10290 [Flavobacterium defluvii]